MSNATLQWDAIVLSGGEGRRLGGVSKAEVSVAGRPLLGHALDGATGARNTVVVGPVTALHPAAMTTREDPHGGGPVAGIAAGVRHLASGAHGLASPWLLVLACDAPRAREVIPALTQEAATASLDVDGVWMVDGDGREQPLVAMYRHESLVTAIASIGTTHGASVRRLTAALTMRAVVDASGATRDADTWDDVAHLREALS